MISQPLIIDETPDAFAELATRYLQDEADDAAVAELDRLLAAEPNLRERFIVLARMHGHLSEIGRRASAGSIDSARLLAVGPATAATASTGSTQSRPRWLGLAVAAGILLITSVIVLALGVTAARSRQLVPVIAASSGAVHLRRDGAEMKLEAGAHLRVGDRLVLNDGAHVSIAMRGGRCDLAAGSEAVIEEIEGLRRRIVLVRGSLEADVVPSDVPLAVQAPRVTVDLRDALVRIQVADSGTRIAVKRGSVEIEEGGKTIRTIPAGEGLDIPALSRAGAASYGMYAGLWRFMSASENSAMTLLMHQIYPMNNAWWRL